jgi:hypothetical protein
VSGCTFMGHLSWHYVFCRGAQLLIRLAAPALLELWICMCPSVVSPPPPPSLPPRLTFTVTYVVMGARFLPAPMSFAKPSGCPTHMLCKLCCVLPTPVPRPLAAAVSAAEGAGRRSTDGSGAPGLPLTSPPIAAVVRAPPPSSSSPAGNPFVPRSSVARAGASASAGAGTGPGSAVGRGVSGMLSEEDAGSSVGSVGPPLVSRHRGECVA